MSRTYVTLGVAVLSFAAVVAGCSASGDGDASNESPSSGSGAAEKGGAPSSGAATVAGAAPGGGRAGGGSSPNPAAGGASGGGGGGAAGGMSFAGSGGMAPTPDGGAGTGEGGSPSLPGDEGARPDLPPIRGTCPSFKSGTATIGGLSGISLEVGSKTANGGGSLLFYWHGTGSSAGEYKSMLPAAVRSELLEAGGIIVSFQSSLGTGGDCSGTATFSKDDFEIADLIAACAVRDHGIDPRRIYTTGCSAGGLQAGCMAALRSGYIAAAVPNSGGAVFPQPLQSTKHVPAAMTLHGGPGDRVVVSFSETSATFDESIKKAGGFVVNCDHGGGHCGAPAPLYAAGWQFMKDHPFGVDPEPYQSSLPSSFPAYCKTY